MRSATAFDELLVAAAADRTTFDSIPQRPVVLESPAVLDVGRFSAIVDRFQRHGFAVVQLGIEDASPDGLLKLGETLGLGEAFVPPLYKDGTTISTGVSKIAAKPRVDGHDAHHPSFESTSALKFHCDGTLQPIGFIKVAMLLCQSPAVEGGDTTVFNAVGAFALLTSVDRRAATALATPGVLVRQANINGCEDINCGPAFAVQNGQLVSGYSVSDTDYWAVPENIDSDDIRRGVAFLLNASLPESPYYAQLTLEAGQVILFDNTRISHGRTPYRDSAKQRRCLFRSLHLVPLVDARAQELKGRS